MRTKRVLGTAIVCALTALLVATFATAQPGGGFSKTSPITGTGSNGSPIRINGCSSDEILKWSGSAWACAADAVGPASTGDIEGVTAGSGLAGGGTSGTVTLDVGAGSGLTASADAIDVGAGSGISVTADAISVNIAGASCSASEAVTAISSIGTGTCSTVGDITSVGATTGGGLTGGASSGAALLGLLTTCTTGQLLEWSGTAWACADDDIGSPGAGDIESVAAGDGLTGGGTVGALTIDVGCGTGLSCAADAVSVNIAGASCSAGEYVSALSATGGGTCTAEVGDIAGVTTAAASGLTGGCTSGTCAVTMLTTCSSTQVLKWNGSAWACAADDTGSGVTGSGTTNTIAKWSSSSAITDSIVTDNGSTVAVGGALTTTGHVTAGDSSHDLTVGRTLYVASGGVAYLGAAGTGSLNFQFSQNSEQTGFINSRGYNGSTGQFRNLWIQDGKGATVASFTGSSKLTTLAGGLTVSGTQTSVVELTASSTATFSHHVNLGDTTADDVSIAGTTHAYGNLNSPGAGKPSVSSCGTSPSQPQSNNGGVITVGSGTATSCTVTFYNSGFAAEPACTLTYQDSGTLYISAKSATGFTFARTDGGNMAGEKADFICLGPDAP